MEETHVEFLEAQQSSKVCSSLSLKKERRWQLFPLLLKVMSLKLR